MKREKTIVITNYPRSQEITLHMVWIGIKEDGDNTWPDNQTGKDGGGAVVAGGGIQYPPNCAKN